MTATLKQAVAEGKLVEAGNETRVGKGRTARLYRTV